MNFGQVVEGLKGNNSNAGGNRRGENIGRRFARAGWNGKGMFIALQAPDSNSKMSREFLFMKAADGHYVPWAPSQTDVLADDWSELDPCTCDEATKSWRPEDRAALCGHLRGCPAAI